MNFKDGEELLKICENQNLAISRAALAREIALTQGTCDLTQGTCDLTQKITAQIYERIEHSLQIMEKACHEPLKNPEPSLGGLIGGEGKQIFDYVQNGGAQLCGPTLTTAISYAMAVLEVNATMGLIVAAPTAGSSGVLPGCLFAAGEASGFSRRALAAGFLNASAIGYLLMENASVAGAEAGCQAEVGAASAMAASALVELYGGSPRACLQGAALALSNLLGLVCDPIGGLVESPCQTRNAIGVANAFTSAQLALAGVTFPIPFDAMCKTMYEVGRALPEELRETALGGCAKAAVSCGLCK